MGQMNKREKNTSTYGEYVLSLINPEARRHPEKALVREDLITSDLENLVEEYKIKTQRESKSNSKGSQDNLKEVTVYNKPHEQKEIGSILFDIEKNNKNSTTTYKNTDEALDFIFEPGGPDRNNYDIRQIIKKEEKDKIRKFYNSLPSLEEMLGIIKRVTDGKNVKKEYVVGKIVIDKELKQKLFNSNEEERKRYLKEKIGAEIKDPVFFLYNPYKKSKDKKEATTPAMRGLLEIGYIFVKLYKQNL